MQSRSTAVLSNEHLCDMVPRHRASPGQLRILLLAWHCARDYKLYPLAGRIGLGTEPSQEHWYYHTSTQSKAAEGPACSGGALCAVLPAVPLPARAMGEASPDCVKHLKD